MTCQHGNELDPEDNKILPCGCMLIDGIPHPCPGCPPTCGNCI